MPDNNTIIEAKLSPLLYEAAQALNAKAFELARKKFQTCLKISPKNPYANFGMAQTLAALNFNEKSGQYYYKAHIYGQEIIEYTFAYACWLMKVARYDNAIDIFQKIIQKIEASDQNLKENQIYKSSLMNSGVILRENKKSLEAVNIYRKLLSLYGRHQDFLFNMGNAFESEGLYQEAIDCFEEALLKAPEDLHTRLNLAYLKNILGKLDEAEDILLSYPGGVNKTVESEINFGLSLNKLKAGNFEEGWKLYNHRWKAKNFIDKQPNFHRPLLHKYKLKYEQNDIIGSRILVISEQGSGDIIMFSLYLEDIIHLAKSVTIVVDRRMMDLYRNSYKNIKLLSLEELHSINLVDYDTVIPIGSLPAIFYSEEKIINSSRYLFPTSKRVSYFSNILNRQNKIHIGISWQGGLASTRSKQRTIELNKFKKLFDLEQIQFVSLQYGEAAKELNEFQDLTQNEIIQFSQDIIRDFDSLAAIIENLDFVISVQNTVVHLCGALGKKCYVAVPFLPEWRYGISEKKMQHYQSVELIRQTQDGSWEDVINLIYEKVRVVEVHHG